MLEGNKGTVTAALSTSTTVKRACQLPPCSKGKGVLGNLWPRRYIQHSLGSFPVVLSDARKLSNRPCVTSDFVNTVCGTLSSLSYFSCFRQGGQNKHHISNKVHSLVPYLASHYFFGNKSYGTSFINQSAGQTTRFLALQYTWHRICSC